MHGYRRFCNKIYQATKYVLGKLPADFTPLPLGNIKSGQGSLAELWILHKFTLTADEVNKALASREFSKATQATYAYWYDYLCDVFIENSKSIIQNGRLEEQHSVQQTLYTALDGGLTLLHPFMPFVTEELWQRLPRRPDDTTPSIVKARYPQYVAEYESSKSAEDYELVMTISKAVRSLAAQYGIIDNANVFIVLSDTQTRAMCKAELAAIKSLCGKAMYGDSANIQFLGDKDVNPAGCVVAPINATTAVHLVVKGRIDIDAEIRKADGRLEKANETIKRVKDFMAGERWEKMRAKNPAAQTLEKERLENAEKEAEVMQASIAQFEKLKLE